MNAIELSRSKAPGASAGAMLCVLRLPVVLSSGGELWRRDLGAARGGGDLPRERHERRDCVGQGRRFPGSTQAGGESGEERKPRCVGRLLAVSQRGIAQPPARTSVQQARPVRCTRLTKDRRPDEGRVAPTAQRPLSDLMYQAADGAPQVRRRSAPNRVQSSAALRPVEDIPGRGSVRQAHPALPDNAGAATKPMRLLPVPWAMTGLGDLNAGRGSPRARANRPAAAALAPRGRP